VGNREIGAGAGKLPKVESAPQEMASFPRTSPPEKEKGDDFSGTLQVIQILIL